MYMHLLIILVKFDSFLWSFMLLHIVKNVPTPEFVSFCKMKPKCLNSVDCLLQLLSSCKSETCKLKSVKNISSIEFFLHMLLWIFLISIQYFMENFSAAYHQNLQTEEKTHKI